MSQMKYMASADRFDAVILDLDGVITHTAAVHARAWKRMFDEFLRSRETAGHRPYEPFDAESDYRRYVDGKPRYEGVKSFLKARDIEIAEGEASDSPDQETICGLGNRKNEVFRRLLQEDGVEVFDSTIARICEWRAMGKAIAVVSSSRNCAPILKAASLEHLFDVRVDGEEAGRLGLAGKPAPDTFLEAARRLGVQPRRAVVIEDAVVGVQAGRAGGFGLVVGVDRTGDADALLQGGADVVVQDVGELRIADRAKRSGGRPASELPSALAHMDRITDRLRSRRPAVFLDYDGTLTPIVSRPEQALLSEEMRRSLAELARRCTVAIVSGRDRADVEKLVGLQELIYAGSHGFDIAGPGGMRLEHQAGTRCLDDLDRAEQSLREAMMRIPGSQIERKRFAVAVHFRNAAPELIPRVKEQVDRVALQHDRLRKTDGKMVFELRPDIDWHKGRAVHWLLKRLALDRRDAVPIYVGDDVTDEDAFAAMDDWGIGVLVGDHGRPTVAELLLRDVNEVGVFLQRLTELAAQSS